MYSVPLLSEVRDTVWPQLPASTPTSPTGVGTSAAAGVAPIPRPSGMVAAATTEVDLLQALDDHGPELGVARVQGAQVGGHHPAARHCPADHGYWA